MIKGIYGNKVITMSKGILPKTGQTTSYATGDDGDYEAGNPQTTRFFDQGDGTVYDSATHLYWVKQPELIIPDSSGQVQSAEGAWADATSYVVGDLVTHGGAFYVCITAHTSDAVDDEPGVGGIWDGKWVLTVWTASAANLTTPATMDWTDALSACESLDYCGHTDWRLPNAFELYSLINYGASPFIYANFPNTEVGNYYQTNTTKTGLTEHAYFVSFAAGRHTSGVKTNSYYVRPVRGGAIND